MNVRIRTPIPKDVSRLAIDVFAEAHRACTFQSNASFSAYFFDGLLQVFALSEEERQSRLLGKTLTLAPETKTHLPDKEKHYKKLKEKID